MKSEQVKTLLESRWECSRKEERKWWVKHPEDFAVYISKWFVRGHSFLRLSPEGEKQVAVDREFARQAALEFIKGRVP